PMQATSYLGDDILPRGKKARAMLAYLCLAGGEKVPRIQLARMLWDEASDDLARGSLRHALSELCSAMGPLAAELISTRRTTVRLNTANCWIDAAALLESSSPDAVRCDLALVCSGKLLEGLDGVSASFDRWLTRERDRFNWKTTGLLRAQNAPAPLDERHLLQRSLPRGAFSVRRPLPGRNRLRVAVLPFEGRGEGKSAERGEDLAFSLSHDIAAGLARFRWFDVIAPISFSSEDFLQRKDLDYAVDGSVARHGR